MNHERREIIFGAWDVLTDENFQLILSESWAVSNKTGRKANAYPQSLKHIHMVLDEGYSLYTFPMKLSAKAMQLDPDGPSKIGGFTPQLSLKNLVETDGKWFATDRDHSSNTPHSGYPNYLEGGVREVTINAYERNPDARRACLEHHGLQCKICSFDFEREFGERGAGYIHVHHLTLVSSRKGKYRVDPISDLLPVCPNCHAMFHKTKPPCTPEELRKLKRLD